MRRYRKRKGYKVHTLQVIKIIFIICIDGKMYFYDTKEGSYSVTQINTILNICCFKQGAGDEDMLFS